MFPEQDRLFRRPVIDRPDVCGLARRLPVRANLVQIEGVVRIGQGNVGEFPRFDQRTHRNQV
ncbi:hypothetical protein D3C76_1541700 [compost metagenome]